MKELLASLQGLQAQALDNDVYSFEVDVHRRYDKGSRRIETYITATVFLKEPKPDKKGQSGNFLYASFNETQKKEDREEILMRIQAHINPETH